MSDCLNQSDTWLNKYRTPGHWIPDETTPIKTILVNWIVCAKEDSSSVWKDTPQFREKVELMFDSVNTWYSNSLPKGYASECEPAIDFITDTRIRFELNEIIFIYNDVFNVASTQSQAHSIFVYLEQYHPEYKKAMNHFFTEGKYRGFYSVNSTFKQSYVLTRGWNAFTEDFVDRGFTHHFCHEYGHAVGLHHTYNGEYKNINHFDFLDDVFGLCAEPLVMDPENSCYDSCGVPHTPPYPCPCINSQPESIICFLTRDCFFLNFPEYYPLMSGAPNPRYISPKYAGRMHRDLSLYNNDFKISNKPMHKYVIEKYSYEIPLTITEDETWDFAIKMYQDIVVEAGNTLTIKCVVKMPIDGKITVKPGAKLIIDGGTITSAHDELWDGIYVEGNTSAPSQSTSYQGYLKIKNAAKIKNAYAGVRNYGLKANGRDDWNKTGGIILAYSSYFINNRWDVSFLKYQKFYTSGAPRPDKSGFYSCVFVDNNKFFASSAPARSIGLYKVHNVKIKGCTFSDDRSGLADYQKSTGIESSHCNFTVDDYLGSETEFNNLKYAIKAFDYDAASIVIQNADFDCYKGIYLNGISDAKINRNNFFVDEENNYGGDDEVTSAYGVYLDMCFNYEVEKNSFKSNSAVASNNNAIYSSAYGVVVYNRHGEAEKIYHNTFNNFYVATEAIGQNKSVNTSDKIGLQFLCNNFSNDKYDVFVTPNFFYNPDPIVGISYYQGEPVNATDKLAGNLFGNSSPYLQSNYLNNGDFLIYRHHRTSGYSDVRPKKYSNIYLQHVYTQLYNPDLSCPTQFGGGDGGDDDDDVILIAALKTTAKVSADEVVVINFQLSTMVDGGNTEQLVNDVVLTNDADAWKKYKKLKKNEGYLSEEVLLALSKKENGFSKAMIRNVMVANPQAAKSKKVQQSLDNRGDQLPGYMRKQIDKGLTKMSAKEDLEMAKAAHKTKHDHAINKMVRLLKRDTLNDRSAEIISALSNTGDINFDYKLVKYYEGHGQFNNADILLDKISSSGLTNNQQKFYNKYTDYRNLTSKWKQSGVDMAALDSTKLLELAAYAELNNTIAAKAIALLQLNGANSYIEPVYLPEGGDKSNSDPKQESSIINENKMLLFPNPADGYFMVDYNLTDPFNKAVLVVFDISGRVIVQLEIHNEIDQLIIPAENWPNGQYTISLFADGLTIMTKKIAITN
jgi:predicted Zn-dependent protease